MRTEHHPYYGRCVRAGGYVALQYWFFYPFNDWRSRIYGVNDHEADWEQVVVYLAEQPEGPPLPTWVVFSAHDETGDDCAADGTIRTSHASATILWCSPGWDHTAAPTCKATTSPASTRPPSRDSSSSAGG
jgi:hypothetical protein